MLSWRLCVDVNESLRQRAERLSLRIVGLCFLAPWHSTSATTQFPYWSSTRAPEQSIPGILLALACLIVMPLLTHATRKVAHGIGNAVMKADATQSEFWTWLSAILLGGWVLNALFGWWWADPAAGLLMVPILAKEGVAGLRGDPLLVGLLSQTFGLSTGFVLCGGTWPGRTLVDRTERIEPTIYAHHVKITRTEDLDRAQSSLKFQL